MTAVGHVRKEQTDMPYKVEHQTLTNEYETPSKYSDVCSFLISYKSS